MAEQIIISKADASDLKDKGCATAVVRVLDKQLGHKGYYLMSCLHVLGLTFQNYPDYDTQTNVFFESDPTTLVATYTAGIRGTLYFEGQNNLSFDAALAKIKNEDNESILNIKNKIATSSFSDFVYYPEDMPKVGKVLTARGPVNASNLKIKRGTQQPVIYGHTRMPNTRAFHRVIVEYDASTLPGDSGSPVVNEAGSMFLGMHIAGNGAKGYMIPAIDLIGGATRFMGADFKPGDKIFFA